MKQCLCLVLLLSAYCPGSLAQDKKVLVLSRMGPDLVKELREAVPGITVVAGERENLASQIADADGVIGSISPESLRAAKKLRWIQIESAGVERILTPELRKRDIVLTNCKILQGPEIADHAMAMLLALTRELHRAIPNRVTEAWSTRQYQPLELLGKTAIVIGVGGIGTQIAVRAHAFGMTVVGVDPKDIPYLPFLSRAVPPDRLDEFLPQADVVFVSAPDTPETRRMMGPSQFKLMKKGSYFIAVSRGALYDLAALVEALDSRRLAGAGVDVTDPEPLPKGHPLWKFENAVITPHYAGRSDGEFRRDLELFKENLRRFAKGLPLLNVVDKEKGY